MVPQLHAERQPKAPRLSMNVVWTWTWMWIAQPQCYTLAKVKLLLQSAEANGLWKVCALMAPNFWWIAATIHSAYNLPGNNNTSVTDIDTLPCQSSCALAAVMIYLWLVKQGKKKLEHYCQKIT